MRSRIKFWLILLFVVLAELTPSRNGLRGEIPLNSTFPTYQRFKQKSIDFSPDDIPSLSNIPHSRFKRATDNLKPVVDRLQKLARVTNGIYLLQGLTAGRILSDELVSELLFLDLSTFSELPNITASINSLKDIPTMLESTAERDKIENALKDLKNIIDTTDGFKKLGDFDEDNFKRKINSLAGKGINLNFFDIIGGLSYSWDESFTTIMNGDPPTVSKTTFANIKSSLLNIKTSIQRFNSSFVSDWYSNQFKKLVDGISLLAENAGGADIITISSQKVSDVELQAYINYVEEVANSTNEYSDSSMRDIGELVTKIVMKPHKRHLQHTHGLPNGSRDFVQMFKNVKDEWIREVVKTDEIIIQFQKLADISSITSGMYNSLDFGNAGRMDINRLVEYGKRIIKATNIDQLKNGNSRCSPAQVTTLKSSDFANFVTILEQIGTTVLGLKNQTDYFLDAFSTPDLEKMCDDLLKIIDQANDIPTTTQHFKEYAQLYVLNETINNVIEIHKGFRDIELKSLAKSASSKISILDDFIQCQVQKKNDLVSLFGLSKEIKSIRELNSDQKISNAVKTGLDIVSKLNEVKKEMKTLNKTLDKMKGEIAFEEFVDVSSISETIGTAVTGISNMENALVQKAVVDKINQNLQVVKANQHLISLNGFVGYLKELLDLETKIPIFYQSLNQFASIAKDSDSIILENHSEIFKQALSVKGLNGSFQNMRKWVGELKSQVSDPGDKKKLEVIDETLETMDSMGLDFSSYKSSFKESRKTLRTLDAYFAKLQRKFADSKLQAGSSKQWYNKFISNWYCLAGSIVVLLFIIVIIINGAMWICCPLKLKRGYRQIFKRRNNKSKMELFEKYLNTMLTMIAKSEKMEVEELLKSDAGEKVYNVLQKKFNEEYKTKTADEECQIHLKLGVGLSIKRYGEKFKNHIYFARKYPHPDGRTMMVAAEAPEKEHPRDPNRKMMAQKLWWLVKETKTEQIIMLCPHKVFRKLADGSSKKSFHASHSSEFFPTDVGKSMMIGDIRVTCADFSGTEFKENLRQKYEYDSISFKMEVKIPNEKMFNVNLLWVRHWEQIGTQMVETREYGKFNSSVGPMIHALQLIETDKRPPLVISYDGIERCGTLAMAVTLKDRLNDDKPFEFKCIAPKKKKELLPEYVTNHQEYQYAAYILLEYLKDEVNITSEEILKRYNWLKTGLDSYWDELLKTNNDTRFVITGTA